MMPPSISAAADIQQPGVIRHAGAHQRNDGGLIGVKGDKVRRPVCLGQCRGGQCAVITAAELHQHQRGVPFPLFWRTGDAERYRLVQRCNGSAVLTGHRQGKRGGHSAALIKTGLLQHRQLFIGQLGRLLRNGDRAAL